LAPKICLWHKRARFYPKNLLPTTIPLTFFKNASLARLCPLQNNALVAVGATFLLLWKLPSSKCAPGEGLKYIFALALTYALQFSSVSPLAMQKVRAAALRGLVCPLPAATAPAVGLDASSRSSFWRPRAPLASGPSSSSEITSLLINFYPFGTRIFSFSKEKYTFLTKSSDFGPKIPLQNPLREPFRRPLFGSFWPPVLPKNALEPNTFAFRIQKSASCTSGEQIFTFSRPVALSPRAAIRRSYEIHTFSGFIDMTTILD